MQAGAPVPGCPVGARLQGLAPLVDARTRVLVLGSFPGAASLAAQQYYGYPRNHFWPILEAILASCAYSESTSSSQKRTDGARTPATAAEPMPTGYAQRSQWLLAHGVGVWDVYGSCERQGSLDADIRQPLVNDFGALKVLCPGLRLVAHNGGESFKHARHTLALGVPVVKLPSTSPANASWSLERKKAAWEAALGPVIRGEA